MKLRLIKITPEGHDPERMVVTEGSTAHELAKEYAYSNGYPIEEHACANRFECILKDLKRIEGTLEQNAPIILKLPALDGVLPYNDELSQCFTNIEIACNEEMDDPELTWMQNLPTYEEYTKGWSLQQKLEMYYEKDIKEECNVSHNMAMASYKWTCADIASILEMGKDWLPDFELRFKEYLQEREYIR